MTHELFLIKYYYGMTIEYKVDSQHHEVMKLKGGITLEFIDWDAAKLFISDVTPKYADFLKKLCELI